MIVWGTEREYKMSNVKKVEGKGQGSVRKAGEMTNEIPYSNV